MYNQSNLKNLKNAWDTSKWTVFYDSFVNVIENQIRRGLIKHDFRAGEPYFYRVYIQYRSRISELIRFARELESESSVCSIAVREESARPG